MINISKNNTEIKGNIPKIIIFFIFFKKNNLKIYCKMLQNIEMEIDLKNMIKSIKSIMIKCILKSKNSKIILVINGSVANSIFYYKMNFKIVFLTIKMKKL